MAAKQTHLQSICEIASGDLMPEILGKILRRVIFNFCRADGSEVRDIPFCYYACEPILSISCFDRSNQDYF